MSKYKVCVEQYHDLAASLLQTGGGEGREDDFFMAIERGDVEGVKCILSSIQPLDIKSWVNLKKGDETRDTPLIIAATRGYPELVKLLIQMGADPTVTNANNITSLHVTRDNCRELILKSANRTPSKTTALITSSWLGNKFTVEDILKRGQVDVNTRNLDYFTPLLLVTRDIEIFDKISFDDTVEYDPVHVAAELISYNTNVMKACDDLGRNAVHLAAGHTGTTAQKLVDLLLNNCVDEDLGLKDSRANTPLHYATQSGDREIVANLIRHGANPNAVGERGYTPLHISAKKGTVELAGFLLGSGADIRIVDDRGDSAYQLASTDGMKRKLKEAWTEATQLERTDSEITITNSCLLDQTGEQNGCVAGAQDYLYPYQRDGPLTPPTHHRGIRIGTDRSQDLSRHYVNELGVRIHDPNNKSSDTRTNQNPGYLGHNLAPNRGVKPTTSDDEGDVYVDDEEALDQLRGLPGQLLASKAVRISGNSVLEASVLSQSSQAILYSQRNIQNLQAENLSTKKKARRFTKRKVLKPPTEDKLKALSMPKYPRVPKEQIISTAKALDNAGINNQSKRLLASTTQYDTTNTSQSNPNLTEIPATQTKQHDTIKPISKPADTSPHTARVGVKTKGVNLKHVKETKSSVFDRLHKTPIRNMKATAKSDINLLTQIHEEPDATNITEPKPVLVNIGGIKGLGIGGTVVVGQNKDNNPLKFFLLDVNQLPEKRRAVNEVYKPTGQCTVTSKQRPVESNNIVQPISLAVVAQKFAKPQQQDLHLQVQTRKQTQSDSVVYDLKTPAQELNVLELKRFNTTQQGCEDVEIEEEIKEESSVHEEAIINPPEQFEGMHTPTPQSPPPDRPCTPVPSHFSLPRVSQSPQLVRSRTSSFIETSVSLSSSLRKSSLPETENPFLPQISPGRSISNPEKHSSLRARSKSSDCLTLSKSLTSINLKSNPGSDLELEEAIFCPCSPLTYRPPSPSAGVPSSPVSARKGTPREDEVVSSPKVRHISSPVNSILTRPPNRNTYSIIQKPLLASVDIGQASPTQDLSHRISLPSICHKGTAQQQATPEECPHKSRVSMIEDEVTLYPSIPEIEKEAVNSEEIVSVLGKTKSKLTPQKSCLSPSLPSKSSRVLSEHAECDRESDYDSDEDTTEVIRWKRGAVLGIGAYGTVVRGLTLDKGMIIAVKQIELNYYDKDKAMKQYELVKAEVDVLKRLSHGNIVKYLGSCLDNMTVNIFMEFVAGGSVARLLKTYGPFEESFLRNYTRQIVSGVKYLHSKNVIHRDVKGDNIMVEPSGCIKLIDFGCARAFRDESATLTYDKFTMLCKSMKGTVYWMAPEVIREEEYNEKADIWSIGCTVFEMATGKPPWAFKDISQEAALFRIGMGYDLPELPDTLSDGVKEFINRCLQQDPSNRPSAKQLLLTHFLRESF